ncbi:MAG: glycoside hydrolase family 30 protein [Gemmatimonadota bacterium]|nr:MAG: glycoside hydrolase family 30 protein [Gemmatimonadota bacterium]
MKTAVPVLAVCLVCVGSQQSPPTVRYVTSSEARPWQHSDAVGISQLEPDGSYDIEIHLDAPEQVIDGFGGSFNELGWEAMTVLDDAARREVMAALFSKDGCNFGLCRMPIGANDFALNWYSLNETPGDYAMAHFSIERDRQRIIPYIHLAMELQPDLRIWGSPWSPPSWMKQSGYYACRPSRYNDLDPDAPFAGADGPTDFITDARTQDAYALYFAKYVQAYRGEGIDVYAVQPQNEPHSCQPFPSSLWQGEDLKNFVRDHLGPLFRERGMDTEIWYGTFERPYEGQFAAEMDSLFNDAEAMQYISGVGFQWAGKGAIAAVHEQRPQLELMHTETECGNGENTWAYAEYTYDLWRHYFDHGANAQLHWNMILSVGQVSTWGWRQNSMISVDSSSGAVRYNPEFYVVKHFSHFIQPGARKLHISGDRRSELAFRNPDGSIVLVLHNENENAESRRVKIGVQVVELEIAGHAFGTVVVGQV